MFFEEKWFLLTLDQNKNSKLWELSKDYSEVEPYAFPEKEALLTHITPFSKEQMLVETKEGIYLWNFRSNKMTPADQQRFRICFFQADRKIENEKAIFGLCPVDFHGNIDMQAQLGSQQSEISTPEFGVETKDGFLQIFPEESTAIFTRFDTITGSAYLEMGSFAASADEQTFSQGQSIGAFYIAHYGLPWQITSIAVAPQNRLVVSGHGSCYICLWSLKSSGQIDRKWKYDVARYKASHSRHQLASAQIIFSDIPGIAPVTKCQRQNWWKSLYAMKKPDIEKTHTVFLEKTARSGKIDP